MPSSLAWYTALPLQARSAQIQTLTQPLSQQLLLVNCTAFNPTASLVRLSQEAIVGRTDLVWTAGRSWVIDLLRCLEILYMEWEWFQDGVLQNPRFYYCGRQNLFNGIDVLCWGLLCVGDFFAVGTVQDVSSTIAPCHWWHTLNCDNSKSSLNAKSPLNDQSLSKPGETRVKVLQILSTFSGSGNTGKNWKLME